MHLASPQRNTDVNAEGFQTSYKIIITQGRSAAIQANFFYRNTLQFCYLFLKKPNSTI
jgi:hypothetical protein